MAHISPPKYVLEILRRLDGAGETGYLVGGCVRDLLLGKRPNDWDLCSSASPEKVMELFPRCHPTGIKHGTVTVVSHGRAVEVTTFRADGPYGDHRHPEYVEFVRNLPDDLARRDFTINAMAMDAEGELTDLFSGREDLARGLIRCVGEPERRFTEDALRMLRAFRFSAALGFEIEAETMSAIERLHGLSRDLAAERVQAELGRVLLSPHPERAGDMLRLELIPGAVYGDGPDFSPLASLPRKGAGRWAAFCAILLDKGCISDSKEFLTALRLDAQTIKAASAGSMLAAERDIREAAEWKRQISRLGEPQCFAAAAAMDALRGKGHAKLLRSVLNSGECFRVKDLKIDGKTVREMGLEGPDVGAALNALLEHVIECPGDNDPQILEELAREFVFSIAKH